MYTIRSLFNMAGNEAVTEKKKINLRSYTESSERGEGFWNSSLTEMKFSVEREWIKSVRSADNKPNYGMEPMDGLLEEVVGNKLEMVGPMIDSYLKETGKAISQKLRRSKATGLMAPVVLFFPWVVFRHVLTLARGYSGEVKTSCDGRKHTVVFNAKSSVEKLFAPSRFSGENFIAHRHFKNVPSKTQRRLVSVFNGRSIVVVTNNTPFTMDYSMKTERLTVTFFVQRYTAEKLAIDTSLQALMNRGDL